MSAARERLTGRPVSSNMRGWRRPTLVGTAGIVVIGLVAGWPARAADPPSWQLAVVVSLVVAAVVWIRSGRRGQVIEQVGPWVLLVAVVAAVQATGDMASPYRPLYALIVLYAAAFLPRRRYLPLLVATALATVAAVLRTGAPLPWADAAVGIIVWGSASLFLHGLVARLDSAAQTDGLTGLWNHAAFWRQLQAEDGRARRSGSPYSVLMIDVDHFKALNDRHGHQAGDAVLRRMADVLANRVRGSDVLARYGGEEFAVLLPDTSQARAAEVAEKLRRLLVVVGINVSIGVADNADMHASADEVVGAADAALYEAKLAGRARVRTAPAASVIALPVDAPGYRRASG
jgi:diguanylate cyclase (GGDEF)-like protein